MVGRARLAGRHGVNFGFQAKHFRYAVLCPNPVKDQLFLEVGREGNYEVSVYNQLGQLVMKDEIQISGNPQVSISVSSLEEGVYLLELSQENIPAVRQNFIKAGN